MRHIFEGFHFAIMTSPGSQLLSQGNTPRVSYADMYRPQSAPPPLWSMHVQDRARKARTAPEAYFPAQHAPQDWLRSKLQRIARFRVRRMPFLLTCRCTAFLGWRCYISDFSLYVTVVVTGLTGTRC